MTQATPTNHPFVNVTQIRGSVANFNEETGGVDAVVNLAMTPINVNWLRCFYPRKDDKPGTRITFNDGGGFAIEESYADFRAKVFAKGRFADLTMVIGETVQEYGNEGSDDLGGGGEDETQDQIPTEVVEQVGPVCVNAVYVRSFNERNDNKPGTRLTFANGRGMPVTEPLTTTYERLIGIQVTAIAGPTA